MTLGYGIFLAFYYSYFYASLSFISESNATPTSLIFNAVKSLTPSPTYTVVQVFYIH